MSHGETPWGRVLLLTKPSRTISLATCSSMIGVRGTFRTGSTCPWARSNGKNFATTVSPWVVTPDALEAFRTKGIEVEGRPEVQGYLRETKQDSVFDLKCEIDLTSKPLLPMGHHDICVCSTNVHLQRPRGTLLLSRECRRKTSSGRFRKCSHTTLWVAVPCAQAT